MPDYLTQTPAGVVLNLKIQPRSAKNQLVGRHGDALKIKLTAPPVDGAANKCCCEFLAGLLQIAVSRVEIVNGATSSHKRVLVRNVSTEEVLTRLATQK